MKQRTVAALAGALGVAIVGAVSGAASAAAPERVTVTGEVIDSWCYLSEIMYPEGSAHHQCAIWCAAGGIPVGILAEDGTVYIVLKLEGDATNVANPAVLALQSRQITVEGGKIARDGMNYLLVDKVVADKGVVNLTHADYGVQPFGE